VTAPCTSECPLFLNSNRGQRFETRRHNFFHYFHAPKAPGRHDPPNLIITTHSYRWLIMLFPVNLHYPSSKLCHPGVWQPPLSTVFSFATYDRFRCFFSFCAALQQFPEYDLSLVPSCFWFVFPSNLPGSPQIETARSLVTPSRSRRPRPSSGSGLLVRFFFFVVCRFFVAPAICEQPSLPSTLLCGASLSRDLHLMPPPLSFFLLHIVLQPTLSVLHVLLVLLISPVFPYARCDELHYRELVRGPLVGTHRFL